MMTNCVASLFKAHSSWGSIHVYHPSSFQIPLKQMKQLLALDPFSSIEGLLHRYGRKQHPFLHCMAPMAIWGTILFNVINLQELFSQLSSWRIEAWIQTMRLDRQIRQNMTRLKGSSDKAMTCSTPICSAYWWWNWTTHVNTSSNLGNQLIYNLCECVQYVNTV